MNNRVNSLDFIIGNQENRVNSWGFANSWSFENGNQKNKLNSWDFTAENQWYSTDKWEPVFDGQYLVIKKDGLPHEGWFSIDDRWNDDEKPTSKVTYFKTLYPIRRIYKIN